VSNTTDLRDALSSWFQNNKTSEDEIEFKQGWDTHISDPKYGREIFYGNETYYHYNAGVRAAEEFLVNQKKESPKDKETMILIEKSETADSRTCDFSKVTKEQLLKSSYQHIQDVSRGLALFSDMLQKAAENHDYTKIKSIDAFHKDFQTGFEKEDWYEMHKKTERHHISVPEGVRADINLIDVLEYLTDCIMAGTARTGKVTKIELSNETLKKAFENTVTLLKEKTVLI